MQACFIIDPLESFDPIAETTSYFIQEAQKRKWECFVIELKDLYLLGNQVKAQARKIFIQKTKSGFQYKILSTQDLNLTKVDVIFLRKDPPVDLNFIDHLSILELLKEKTLLINNPTSIKQASEKIFSLYFPDFSPKTLVSKSSELIFDFVKKHKEVVLKPLNLSGGRGVVKTSSKDPSLRSLIEILTDYESKFIMAQKYVPEVKKGDKRILLFNGEYLGSFIRIPDKNDFRGNLHSGASLKKSTLSTNEKKMIQLLGPKLKEMELYFVGIDLIGKYVTEINVTSPMGVHEINHLENTRIERKVIDWVESQL